MSFSNADFLMNLRHYLFLCVTSASIKKAKGGTTDVKINDVKINLDFEQLIQIVLPRLKQISECDFFPLTDWFIHSLESTCSIIYWKFDNIANIFNL